MGYIIMVLFALLLSFSTAAMGPDGPGLKVPGLMALETNLPALTVPKFSGCDGCYLTYTGGTKSGVQWTVIVNQHGSCDCVGEEGHEECVQHPSGTDGGCSYTLKAWPTGSGIVRLYIFYPGSYYDSGYSSSNPAEITGNTWCGTNLTKTITLEVSGVEQGEPLVITIDCSGCSGDC